MVHKGVMTKSVLGSPRGGERTEVHVAIDVAVKTLYSNDDEPLITRFKLFQNEVEMMRYTCSHGT